MVFSFIRCRFRSGYHVVGSLWKSWEHGIMYNLFSEGYSRIIRFTSGGGGSGIIVEPITITQNGTTTAPSGKAYSPITVNVPKEVVLNVPVLPDGFTIERNASQGGSLVIRSSTAFSYFYVEPTGTYKSGSLDVTEGSLGNVDRNSYICIFRDSNYNTLIGMGRWRDYEALTN